MDMLPKIYTLTGNLLAERTLVYEDWSVGRTQRALTESFNTRGKGVNVTNMLARLGTPSIALIFAGGASGTESQAWLQQRGLSYQAFTTRAPSRTGTVIWSETQAETTFLGPDSPPDSAAVQACADFLDAQTDGQVLALCGSFPGWQEPHFDVLRGAIQRWGQRGRLLADVYGPPLQSLAREPVELVKINRQEFDAMFPTHDPSLSMAGRLKDIRKKSAVKNWVISNGGESIWVQVDGEPAQELQPPRIKEISPTGSGDVMFAGILHALIVHGLDLPAAVKFALPYAAANAAHTGVADFELPT